jgi:hypothetical protein
MERGGSKLRFIENSIISMKFLNHHELYRKYGTLVGLGTRPQAQVNTNLELKTISALRPFERT